MSDEMNNNVDLNNPYAQPAQPVNPQPAYNPAYNYAQQPVNPQPVSKKNSIIAMVLGICGLCFSSLGIIGIVLSAVSMGIRGKFVRENNGQGNGFCTAAKVTSILGLIFSIFAVIFWIVFIIIMVFVAAEYGGAVDFRYGL